MNLPALQSRAQLQNDIKASKTIAITVAAYFICYVPTIIHAVASKREGDLSDSWFAFIVWYILYLSTAVNPIIYYVRTSRFRSAFKQFLRDPFGSSDFRDKPRGRDNGKENRALQGAAVTEKNSNEEANGNGNQEKYHGERGNGVMVLSIIALQAHPCVLGAGECNVEEREKLPRKEALGSMFGFKEKQNGRGNKPGKRSLRRAEKNGRKRASGFQPDERQLWKKYHHDDEKRNKKWDCTDIMSGFTTLFPRR